MTKNKLIWLVVAASGAWFILRKRTPFAGKVAGLPPTLAADSAGWTGGAQSISGGGSAAPLVARTQQTGPATLHPRRGDRDHYFTPPAARTQQTGPATLFLTPPAAQYTAGGSPVGATAQEVARLSTPPVGTPPPPPQPGNPPTAAMTTLAKVAVSSASQGDLTRAAAAGLALGTSVGRSISLAGFRIGRANR